MNSKQEVAYPTRLLVSTALATLPVRVTASLYNKTVSVPIVWPLTNVTSMNGYVMVPRPRQSRATNAGQYRAEREEPL